MGIIEDYKRARNISKFIKIIEDKEEMFISKGLISLYIPDNKIIEEDIDMGTLAKFKSYTLEGTKTKVPYLLLTFINLSSGKDIKHKVYVDKLDTMITIKEENKTFYLVKSYNLNDLNDILIEING